MAMAWEQFQDIEIDNDTTITDSLSQEDGREGPSEKILSLNTEDKSSTSSSSSRKNRLPLNSKIAIVGTGVSGLSAAIALRKHGFQNIVLYERDDHFHSRKEGYGLTLSYGGSSGPLSALGLLEEVAKVDCPSRSHYLFRPDGSVLGYYGNAFHGTNRMASMRGFGQRGNLRVPRQILRKIMLNELFGPGLGANDSNAKTWSTKGIKLQWGKRLDSFLDPMIRSGGEANAQLNTSKQTISRPIQLRFTDGTVDDADFLVGADGIRSTIINGIIHPSPTPTYEQKEEKRQNKGQLQYLGVFIILGITNDSFFHPLLDERGFYTLDGTHRLFTMPFEGCRLDDCEHYYHTHGTSPSTFANVSPKRRIMWQLSFRLDDETEAKNLSSSGAAILKGEVLRRCATWHSPVCDMIQSTELRDLWGTGLMDRNPHEILTCIKQQQQRQGRLSCSSRVVAMGDAVHAMSPFKGQGANQSLMDGPLLASWLTKSTLRSAVSGFMREMVQRTHPKVRASREAATLLHSPHVFSVADAKHDFAGVQRDTVPRLLQVLRERGIGANLGADLDSTIQSVMMELEKECSMFCMPSRSSDKSVDIKDKEEQALRFASAGDAIGLRYLSTSHPEAIQTAKDDMMRTPLHLAALNGQYHVCRWLLSEAHLYHGAEDSHGETPLDYAKSSGNEETERLLASICVDF